MRWIILDPFDVEESATIEWEAAGTVIADSEEDAVQMASAWPFVRHRNRLRAIEWKTASQADREDALAEDRARLEMSNDSVRASAALLMLGVNTALIADYPVLNRALDACLRRPQSESEGSVVFLAYASCLFDAACRTAASVLDHPAAGVFARTLQVEFPKLLSSGSEGSLSPDDWISMTEPFREPLGSAEVGTAEYAREFGALIAGIVGRPADPEITGQTSVMMWSTIAKLRLREVIGSAPT